MAESRVFSAAPSCIDVQDHLLLTVGGFNVVAHLCLRFQKNKIKFTGTHIGFSRRA